MEINASDWIPGSTAIYTAGRSNLGLFAVAPYYKTYNFLSTHFYEAQTWHYEDFAGVDTEKEEKIATVKTVLLMALFTVVIPVLPAVLAITVVLAALLAVAMIAVAPVAFLVAGAIDLVGFLRKQCRNANDPVGEAGLLSLSPNNTLGK